MKIGRRIYYEIETGNVITDIGEREGSVVPTTVEQEIVIFKVLSERNRESFDYIELEYGQFSQDFLESSAYRVNPETRKIEFSYPDPNIPEEPQPYQVPLSEEVIRLTKENLNQDLVIEELLFVIIPEISGGGI